MEMFSEFAREEEVVWLICAFQYFPVAGILCRREFQGQEFGRSRKRQGAWSRERGGRKDEG